MVPGLLLVACYLIYLALVSRYRPEWAPPISQEEIRQFRTKGFLWRVIKAFFMPFLLIFAVLGSIFWGVASPTEAAAVGALGATILTIIQGRFKWNIFQSVMRETTMLTSMVFMILLGATTFSFVFREMEGDRYLVELVQNANLPLWGFLLLVMMAVFVIGFFIDFIEIIFIVVPVVAPIFHQYGVDLVWIGVLLGLNLQTSFLTPPFGFSLFYLKGVAPPEVTTGHLYRGIIPFVVIQLIFLLLVAFFPELILIR